MARIAAIWGLTMAMTWRARLVAGAALCSLGVAHTSYATTFDELLSIVFFEYELAYKDTQNFLCQHIAMQADGDYCRASFEVLDPATCKVKIVREIRATWGEGKRRDHFLASDVWTLANLNLDSTQQEWLPDQKATRLRFEGIVEVHRHEGHSYSFELDDKANYWACRLNDTVLEIPEQECIAKGTEQPSSSSKMSLLFQRFNFQKGLDALRALLADHCPRSGIKS